MSPSSDTVDNPFATLGPPPAGGDPQEHVEYFTHLVEAFDQAKTAAIRPLRKRLHEAMRDLTERHEAGEKPEIIVKHFHEDLQDLRKQTFDLVHRSIKKARDKMQQTLRSRRGTPASLHVMQVMHKSLGMFSKALRLYLKAEASQDVDGKKQARQMVDDARAMAQDLPESRAKAPPS